MSNDHIHCTQEGSMFNSSALAVGVLSTLTSATASPARLPGPPTVSLAARACDGAEPYVRLNAADWTQIINIIPKDPNNPGYYTRLGGMGAPNNTIDLHFKDDYNQEEFRLATYKEGGTMNPGDSTWSKALEAVDAGAEQSEYIVLDQEYDVSAMRRWTSPHPGG